MLRLFIALINENFDVAEEQKRQEQEKHFLATQHLEQASPLWLRRLNPYRWFEAAPKLVAAKNLPPDLILPMKNVVVQEDSNDLGASFPQVRGYAALHLEGTYPIFHRQGKMGHLGDTT